jgi:hypothetical protein
LANKALIPLPSVSLSLKIIIIIIIIIIKKKKKKGHVKNGHEHRTIGRSLKHGNTWRYGFGGGKMSTWMRKKHPCVKEGER